MASTRQERRHDPLLDRLETVGALGVVAVLALLLTAAAFLRPVEDEVERETKYRNAATFSYSAQTAPDSIYGADGVQVGETILLGEVKAVDVSVYYQLTGRRLTNVTGTGALTATVTVGGGLTRSFPIAETAISKPTAKLDGSLPLADLQAFFEESARALGSAGASSQATITLSASFDVSGTIAGRSLATAFAPSLDLDLDRDSIAVTSESDEPVTSGSPSLNPTEGGEVSYSAREPARFALPLVQPRVDLVRGLGLGVGALALLLLLVISARMRRSSATVSESAGILAAYRSQVVTTTSLDLGNGPVVDVAWIEDLMDLAKRYDSTVLHVDDPEGDQFLVWDNGLTYRYRATHGKGTDAVDRPDDAPGSSPATIAG